MKAKDLLDDVFVDVLRAIESGIIAPGTEQERDFFKAKATESLRTLLTAHGVFFEPVVIVSWNPTDPDALALSLSPETLAVLKAHRLA